MDEIYLIPKKSFNYILFITGFFATYSLLNLIFMNIDYQIRGPKPKYFDILIQIFFFLVPLVVSSYLLTAYLPDNLHSIFYVISALLILYYFYLKIYNFYLEFYYPAPRPVIVELEATALDKS